MLTQMSDADWEIVVAAFVAARSRRGDKGRDDRKFLEALHYFTVHNITWRALPAEFGQMEQRLEAVLAAEPERRLRGDAGHFGRYERHRASRPNGRFDGRARSCLGGRRKGGQENQALGRSRGGFSTKIHLKTDFDGLPLTFHLTSGEASDSRNFAILLDLGPDITPRAVLGDKGYDAKANRQAARRRGICPAIPYRENAAAKPAFFPRILYKGRARIEQAVGKIKRFKRIALRCEKTAQNFAAFLSLACTFVLVKFVHTA
jgi:transposase